VLRNKTKGIVISKEVIFMKGIRKAIGLMFRRNLSETKAWIFEMGKQGKMNCGVHTFFCFCDILVVWLNEANKVVDMEIMKPFSLRIPKKEAKWVIELNPKLKDLISLGDELIFPPVSN